MLALFTEYGYYMFDVNASLMILLHKCIENQEKKKKIISGKKNRAVIFMIISMI